jgi:hypothetical protein
MSCASTMHLCGREHAARRCSGQDSESGSGRGSSRESQRFVLGGGLLDDVGDPAGELQFCLGASGLVDRKTDPDVKAVRASA